MECNYSMVFFTDVVTKLFAVLMHVQYVNTWGVAVCIGGYSQHEKEL